MINVLLFGSRRLNECYFIQLIISNSASVLIGKGFLGHFTLFVRAEVIASGKGDGCERRSKGYQPDNIKERVWGAGELSARRNTIRCVSTFVTNQKFPSFLILSLKMTRL